MLPYQRSLFRVALNYIHVPPKLKTPKAKQALSDTMGAYRASDHSRAMPVAQTLYLGYRS